MTQDNNIQLNGLTDVRNSQKKMNKRARIGMMVAGSGFAGAMLLGGLFGGHASAASAHTNAPVASHTLNVQAAPMSYNTASASQETYRQIARDAARHYGISPYLFERQIQQESGFNPNAYSPAGAEGIAQFMPYTAAPMGVNPWDPTSALYGGARLMSQLSHQFGGNYAKALAAYNGGPGAVQYAERMGGGNWMAYLPTESRNYVHIIMGW